MIKFPSFFGFWILIALGVSGCASSGGPVSSVDRTYQVQQAPLPVVDRSEAGKFSQSSDEDLAVLQGPVEQASSTAIAYHELGQADYVGAQRVGVSSAMLGGWVIRSREEEKAGRLQKLSKLATRFFDGPKERATQICTVQLGSEPVDGGYKADGAASCPTTLFMLESWRPYGEKVILKNHMGDEILRLSNRSGKIWVGIDAQGQTFLMERARIEKGQIADAGQAL